MLIRSQDGGLLINVDRTSAFVASESENGEVGVFAVDHYDFAKGELLGQYAYKAKCKAVMDMIEEAYKKDRQLVPVIVGDGANAVTQFMIYEPQVFQMPKDEEVWD